MKALKLPSLGEGIEKGTVISIMVNVGDVITTEQSLMEIETDKVVVEVPSDAAGIVTEILVDLGDEVSEGMAILKLEAKNMETSDEPAEAKSVADVAVAEAVISAPIPVTKAKGKDAQTIKELELPSLGEGIEKGTVISVLVNVGDNIVAEQALMEVETDKVVVEVPSAEAGIIAEILVNLGDEVSEGIPIVRINAATVEDDAFDEKNNSLVAKVEKEQINEEVKATEPRMHQPIDSERKSGYRSSPLAKKIAREIGIDIASIPAVNPSKRISVQDVKNYAKQLNLTRAAGGVAPSTNVELPDFAKWGAIRREVMTGIMQATSKNMTTSWSQIPHAWLQEKIDITYLEEKRQLHKSAIKVKGGSLTITGILVKTIAKALEDFPIFNASIDQQNNAIVYKDFINIGVAVDSDRGLLVPVLKDANKKSISEIAMELPSLATKVKQKKVTVAELEGATFTISNLGGIGTSAIFPLVTFPQVAIMGVAASQTEAVYIEGQFQPRLIMPLTIGFDHRIINGADAARFLKHIKALLEDWFQWSL